MRPLISQRISLSSSPATVLGCFPHRAEGSHTTVQATQVSLTVAWLIVGIYFVIDDKIHYSRTPIHPKDGIVNEGFGLIDAGEVEFLVVRAGVAPTAAVSGAYLIA